MKTERRLTIKKLFTSAAALLGAGYVARANGIGSSNEKEVGGVTNFQDVPIYSGHTTYNNIVYTAGKVAHVAPFEIKAHTEIVLQELEKELINHSGGCQRWDSRGFPSRDGLYSLPLIQKRQVKLTNKTNKNT